MSDPVTNSHGLIERLRALRVELENSGGLLGNTKANTVAEAADRLDEVEGALRLLAGVDGDTAGYFEHMGDVARFARAALPESPRAERSE